VPPFASTTHVGLIQVLGPTMIARLSILTLFLLSACSNRDDAPAPRAAAFSYPDGACYLNRQYCVTTAAQLLANPSTYDGHLIQVRGWVTSWHGHVYLYLSRELLDGADNYGSIAIEGPSVTEIINVVGVSGAHSPGRSLLVGGRFFITHSSPRGNASPDPPERFWMLREVSNIPP
jgi:hypothetical protein